MTARVIETPVLVVGGGPVGLALAADLGWHGVACTLLEQTDGRVVTPKMNEVNVRTMEFCRRWGIHDRVMNCPFPADHPLDVAYVTSLTGHELARIARPARCDQRPGPESAMTLQACSQTWFDPMLLELARSFDHVSVLHEHRCDGFEATQDGVRAQVTDLRSGESCEVRARHLVGADGAGSAIRRRLGIELVGSPVLSHACSLFFRTPDLLGQLGVKAATFFALLDRGGLWGNVRAIDPRAGLWRLMLDQRDDTPPEAIDRDALLERALGRRIAVDWVGASLWTRRGVVADRYSLGRVHLAGDAVHQVSPTGALGMNTGIGDAVDLAWKIAAVEAGWGGSDLIASYDAERRPVGARNVTMATAYYASNKAFDEPLDAIVDPTPEGATLRSRVAEHIRTKIALTFRTIGLQIGYRYDGSPICVPDGTPAPADAPDVYIPTTRPGARAPHVALAAGRSTLDCFGHGFTLVRTTADTPDPRALEAAAAAVGLPLKCVSLDDPTVARVYERRLVLVRPDGHVAWRGNWLPAEPSTVIDRVRGA